MSGKAFDVILPFNSEDWEQNSWFNVQHGDLCPDSDHLVVGINPPFGMNGNLAGKFVKKCAELKARMIFLIVPPKTKSPHGYKTIALDKNMCRKRPSRAGCSDKG